VIHKRPCVEVEEEELGGSGCAWSDVFECQCVGVGGGNQRGAAGRLVEVVGLSDQLGDAAVRKKVRDIEARAINCERCERHNKQ
jgi:hypothetical protein